MMGYHDAREIPNYWAYAEHYNLQDHMFGATDSWTLPAHLFLVSAWSAHCSGPERPDELQVRPRAGRGRVTASTAARTRRSTAGPTSRSSSYEHDVSWAYYPGGSLCDGPALPRGRPRPSRRTRCPAFTTVHDNGQLGEHADARRLPGRPEGRHAADGLVDHARRRRHQRAPRDRGAAVDGSGVRHEARSTR